MRFPIWLQILAVMCFMALPVLSSPHAFEPGFRLLHGPTIRMLTLHALFVIFFYVHFFFLMEKLYFKRRYWLYSFSIVVIFFLILAIPDILRQFPIFHLNHHTSPEEDFRLMQQPHFWNEAPRHVIILSITLLLGHFIKSNERLRSLRQEKYQAELAFLKSQVNPHFLFNTLNSIYSLSLTKSDRAPEAVVQLSGMMRHVLIDSQEDFIPLEKEIDYLRNFISLQKLRLDESVKLQFDVHGDPAGKFIAPLLLIPIIENTFKHGVNAEENSDIRITIDIQDKRIFLHSSNRKVHVALSEDERTGVGLSNLRDRLRMLYPDHHHLDILDDQDFYDVHLTISFL